MNLLKPCKMYKINNVCYIKSSKMFSNSEAWVALTQKFISLFEKKSMAIYLLTFCRRAMCRSPVWKLLSQEGQDTPNWK